MSNSNENLFHFSFEICLFMYSVPTPVSTETNDSQLEIILIPKDIEHWMKICLLVKTVGCCLHAVDRGQVFYKHPKKHRMVAHNDNFFHPNDNRILDCTKLTLLFLLFCSNIFLNDLYISSHFIHQLSSNHIVSKGSVENIQQIKSLLL